MTGTQRTSPVQKAECGIDLANGTRCTAKTTKNSQYCQMSARTRRCRFAISPKDAKPFSLDGIRREMARNSPRQSPRRQSPGSDAIVCGIDLAKGTRCTAKTTQNAEMCRLNAGNKCTFARNPNTNKNYKLVEVRQALSTRISPHAGQVLLPPASSPMRPAPFPSSPVRPAQLPPTSSPVRPTQLPPASSPARPAQLPPVPNPAQLHPTTAEHPERVRVFTLGSDVTTGLTIGRELGKSGSFGNAFEATVNETNELVVLKRFTGYYRATGIGEDAFKELLLLQHLNAFPATKTVKCHGIAFHNDDQEMYMVIEKLDTDLTHFTYRESLLSGAQIKVLFHKLLHALDAIHGLGVIHSDIKPHNIMIVHTTEDEYDVRFIDFGLSEFLGIGPPKRLSRHYRCTEYTKAPDDSHAEDAYIENGQTKWKYFDGNRKSFVSDVYSLAVTMFNLVFGPLRKVRRSSAGELIVNSGVYTACDPPLQDLLLQMLSNDTYTRFTCEDALRHPYFTGRLDTFNVDFRIGGAGPFHLQIENLINRHESYTKPEYDGRMLELSSMEAMHLNYMKDVIPCDSTAENVLQMFALFEWLKDALHVKSRAGTSDGNAEYPPLHTTTHDFGEFSRSVFLFETMDIIINGMALVASLFKTGIVLSENNRKLFGLVSCHIYSCVFEYEPTPVNVILAKTLLKHDDGAAAGKFFNATIFNQLCLATIHNCNGNIPIKPVWLHLNYLWLKLEYEPLAGAYKDMFDEATLSAVKQLSALETLFYYSFFIKPAKDFSVWNVAQYSVLCSVANRLRVDIRMLSDSRLSEHLVMENFEAIHTHYERQRAVMGIVR